MSLFSGFIPRQLCHYLGNLWAETPFLVFLPLSIYHRCVLSWPRRTSVSHPPDSSLISSFVEFSVLSLSVSVSCFVSDCLIHLHPGLLVS